MSWDTEVGPQSEPATWLPEIDRLLAAVQPEKTAVNQRPSEFIQLISAAICRGVVQGVACRG